MAATVPAAARPALTGKLRDVRPRTLERTKFAPFKAWPRTAAISGFPAGRTDLGLSGSNLRSLQSLTDRLARLAATPGVVGSMRNYPHGRLAGF